MKAHLFIRIFKTLRICHQPSKHSQFVRLLQITDTHLFSDDNACLLGVNTSASFSAVLNEIQTQQIEFDAVVSTGDISQDHSCGSYQRFAKELVQWEQPCYWLPGNHDAQPLMKTTLLQSGLPYFEHVLLGDHWQMLMLDSQVPNATHGLLSPSQLHFLDMALSTSSSRHTLVLLHHHPISVASYWLDQHKLQNSDEFWAIIQKSKSVKGVVCGHIHQALDYQYQNRRILGAPSTCIQFLPQSAHFTVDPSNPGWREITLHLDGTITTQIGRIKGNEFQPDMTSSGY